MPKPGSAEAIEKGCLCPIMENNCGAGFVKNNALHYTIREECPLHSTEKTKKQSNEDENIEEKTPKLSVADIILAVLARAAKLNIRQLPSLDSHLWDILLFDIKQRLDDVETEKGRTLGKIIGDFDWNGPAPKNRNLKDLRFVYQKIYSKAGWYLMYPDCQTINISNNAFRESLFTMKYPKISVIIFEKACKLDGFIQ